MNFKIELSAEERLVYEFARGWREGTLPADLRGIDWTRVARLLCHNRMAVMALAIFERAGALDQIPPAALSLLTDQSEKYRHAAARLGEALSTYLHAAAAEGIDTFVLKGLWLCDRIYHHPAMRPGADIDLLVRREQVQACLDLLGRQGIGEYWPNLLRDEYFARHHLHQQRSSNDLGVWFEIHWALDHPYTLLTIDYAGIFERAGAAQLLGAPVREMCLPDLLLSLAVHLVKHAVYLPSLPERADLPRIILANGMLMYYLDIAEVLKQFGARMDWDLVVRLAHDWGAVDILGSVLQSCSRHLDAPVPPEVLSALPVTGTWAITRRLMARAADQELAAYEGRAGSRLWKLLLTSNGAFILRPIRLLETASYFFPPADFLLRRYGGAGALTRSRHFLTAFRQTIRFGWDTIYFGIERYIRLKRLGKRASLFNTLETDL